MVENVSSQSIREMVFDLLEKNPNLRIKQVLELLPNQNRKTVITYFYDFRTRQHKSKRNKYKQIVKVCVECGKKFLPTAKQQIYCSKKCVYPHHKKNPSLRTCKKCGTKTVSLSKKGLCTTCEFSVGEVWSLDMTNWIWTKKQTEQEPTKPNND